jgi:predicted  nucleic acid-binding Zn-ribbon protein
MSERRKCQTGSTPEQARAEHDEMMVKALEFAQQDRDHLAARVAELETEVDKWKTRLREDEAIMGNVAAERDALIKELGVWARNAGAFEESLAAAKAENTDLRTRNASLRKHIGLKGDSHA